MVGMCYVRTVLQREHSRLDSLSGLAEVLYLAGTSKVGRRCIDWDQRHSCSDCFIVMLMLKAGRIRRISLLHYPVVGCFHATTFPNRRDARQINISHS